MNAASRFRGVSLFRSLPPPSQRPGSIWADGHNTARRSLTRRHATLLPRQTRSASTHGRSQLILAPALTFPKGFASPLNLLPRPFPFPSPSQLLCPSLPFSLVWRHLPTSPHLFRRPSSPTSTPMPISTYRPTDVISFEVLWLDLLSPCYSSVSPSVPRSCLSSCGGSIQSYQVARRRHRALNMLRSQGHYLRPGWTTVLPCPACNR